MDYPHFELREFECPCCKKAEVSKQLIDMLEQMYSYFENCVDGISAITITSGYRCNSYSPKAGGFTGDAHTAGIAVDIVVKKADGTNYDSYTVAAVAEKIGFTGIGRITDTATHVDVRNAYNYHNSFWHGNEMTGNDNIETWAEYLPKLKSTTPDKKHIRLYVNDTLVFEMEV